LSRAVRHKDRARRPDRDCLIDVTPPNAAVPPELSAKGRESFKTYLVDGPNKAFAVASDSRFGWVSGRRSIEEARKAAMDICASGTSQKCRIVNVNNQPAR
jgi:hypothetical protein